MSAFSLSPSQAAVGRTSAARAAQRRPNSRLQLCGVRRGPVSPVALSRHGQRPAVHGAHPSRRRGRRSGPAPHRSGGRAGPTLLRRAAQWALSVPTDRTLKDMEQGQPMARTARCRLPALASPSTSARHSARGLERARRPTAPPCRRTGQCPALSFVPNPKILTGAWRRVGSHRAFPGQPARLDLTGQR